MKLIGIVGTNSDTSTNRKLLLFMKKHFEETVEIDVCEIADIPAFDEPDDKKRHTRCSFYLTKSQVQMA